MAEVCRKSFAPPVKVQYHREPRLGSGKSAFGVNLSSYKIAFWTTPKKVMS